MCFAHICAVITVDGINKNALIACGRRSSTLKYMAYHRLSTGHENFSQRVVKRFLYVVLS